MNLELKTEIESALKEFVHLSERYANVSKLLAERLGPERASMIFTLGTDQIRLPDLSSDVHEERMPGGTGEPGRNGDADEDGEESILDRRNRLRQKAFAGGSAKTSRNASPKPSTSKR